MAKRRYQNLYVDGNTVRKREIASNAVPARKREMPPQTVPSRKRTAPRTAPVRRPRIADPKAAEALREKRERREQMEARFDYRMQQERLLRKQSAWERSFLMIFLLASVVTLGLCFGYLKLQSSVNTRIRSIERKKQELERLRSEDDALRSAIDTSVDPNTIYQIATQQLGMIYEDQGQVITYHKSESEYVRQYENIPKY